jgi:transcriptional regulator with XRE-family HTH domain
MSNIDEREKFRERLHAALRDADYPPDSPTQLAREFNIRYGGKPITVHAARKWLVGAAIPTQEKLRALAQWLGVSAEWLRYGTMGTIGTIGSTDTTGTEQTEQTEQAPGPADAQIRLGPRDLSFLESMRRLDEKNRHIVHTLIRLLDPGE